MKKLSAKILLSFSLIAAGCVLSIKDTKNAQAQYLPPELESQTNQSQDLKLPGFNPDAPVPSEPIFLNVHIAEHIYKEYGELIVNTLFKDPSDPVGGNSNGDVTIVEFFDYNCKFCKNVNPKMKEIIQSDPNDRIVYKEFPILGDSSVLASISALTAHRQGRYVQFHDRLMNTPVSSYLDKNSLNNIARESGLDMDQLYLDIRDQNIIDRIKEKISANRKLGLENLGIKSTPTFLIGTEVIVGDVPLDRIKEAIRKARSGS